MKKIIFSLLNVVIRTLLSLRYTIVEKNKKSLAALEKSGKSIIFLPNHPAEIDPIIMITRLAKKFKPSPLVVENFYDYNGAGFFMKELKAIPIPDFVESVNEFKMQRGEKAYQDVVAAVKEGRNLLIYPSGMLKRDGDEKIGGSSFVHRLLNEVDNVEVVLVRMSGLWGSVFSRAITNTTPNFWKEIMFGVGVTIRNGFFFNPRRKVTIEYSVETQSLPIQESKTVFNSYLESFYNNYCAGDVREKVEPVQRISYSVFSEKLPPIVERSSDKKYIVTTTEVTPSIKKQIDAMIHSALESEKREIVGDEMLSYDLGLDSLAVAELYAQVTKEFKDVQTIEPGDIQTPNDLYLLAINPLANKNTSCSKVIWPEEKFRPMLQDHFKSTITETFLTTCDGMKSAVACADAITGVMTYSRLKISALLLSKHIQKMKGEYIGVMLPSSNAAYIFIFATLLAKKIPVMLNWTTGSRNLNYGLSLLNIESVISSQRFLEKIEHVDIGDVAGKLIFAEEIRKKITIRDKISALLMSKQKAAIIKRVLKLHTVHEDDPAVVLFTSGTESYPKAVPLSHKNLLTNQNDTINTLRIDTNDIMFSVLPPFHSFGFTVTGTLPILRGMRAYFSPDPTDSSELSKGVKRSQATIFACAPTFFKNMLRVADYSDLLSVRIFASGAEKASDELKEKLSNISEDTVYIEGYGITECSPVVSFCRPGKNDDGVGYPLPSLTLKVINPDTFEEVKTGEIGEVCIAGASVFSGYLGVGKKDTFINIDGKRYYRSNDLGKIQNGCLVLSGRLKRFIKIGGEMISLASLESALTHEILSNDDSIPKDEQILVVVAYEEEGKRPRLGVYTTVSLSKEEANDILAKSGFARLMKISHVVISDSIPLLGSGKTNYKAINDAVGMHMRGDK